MSRGSSCSARLSYGLIGSIAAVVYLYTPEIYPTRMRAVGTGVATSWLRIASAIGPTLIGFMLGKGGGIDSVFLMFAAVAIVGLIAATRMIETRNLRLRRNFALMPTRVQLIVTRPSCIDKYRMHSMLERRQALNLCAACEN